MNTKTKSAWMIAVAGALWGIISLFVRGLAALGLLPLQIVFFRNVLAACALGVVMLMRYRQALRIQLRHIWIFVGTGMISIALFNYCYFVTLSQSSVAVASLLLYTSPIFVMFFSLLLFRERMTTNKLLALVVTVMGCACITGVFSEMQLVSPVTVVFGLGSGLFYGLYSIFGKFALRHYSSMTISFYTFVFASLATAPFAAADCAAFARANPSSLLLGIGLAVLCTVAPFLLYTKGLHGVPASHAAVLATIEPMSACIIGTVVFGDAFHIWTALGMVLILSAIVILQIPGKRHIYSERFDG